MSGPGLDAPLVTAVGDRTAPKLATQLDLHTVGDLLAHYPRRYVRRGELTDLGSLRAGEHVTVQAEVKKATLKRIPKLKGALLEVVVTDGSGELSLTWFNARQWRERQLHPGRRAFFSGQVEEFRTKGGERRRRLTHPEYQLLDDDDAPDAAAFAEEIIPIYPASRDVDTWAVKRSVAAALGVVELGEDPLPDPVRRRHRLLGRREALEGIHRPTDWGVIARAKERLKWDEALVLQVVLAQRRAAAAATPARPRPERPGGLLAAFDAALPFTLTAGQREVATQIARDLAAPTAMHRLLQGEVGSGKTVVALRAMLTVVDSGGQAALLAPTEVLAVQHARSLRELLGPLGCAGELGAAEPATRVALLTGSLGAAARRAALAEAEDGAAGIVVGTHALLSEGVRFADLGLVVVDEQHRFGVEQRDVLRAKGGDPPHVLVMTATPIPRTVAMTVYGDLETSALTELPSGRSPITTHVVPSEDEKFFRRTWERVREEVAAGHHAHAAPPPPPAPPPPAPPRRPGEAAGGRPALAVLDVLPVLRDELLTGLRVAPLHGRLPTDVKDDTMRAFARGDLDVVVATTVVEVGVDVPAATVMVVLDADRFGVSQLHQLRGRVGRGSAPGLCLLVTEVPPGSPGRERLDAVAATLDGFALARLDLELRREGNVLGAEQSGRRSRVKLLSLLTDEELIGAARAEAAALVADDPELAGHPALARAAAALDEEQADYLEKA